ncbi:MAG: hypothetical protein O8C63_08715 [Candidatus Methanoperedens sp.]|nr:hypothetical protein [Candidatus Methanoperedens sp.]
MVVNILDAYILNIIGLICDILGAFLISLYVIKGGIVGFQKYLKFISKFSSVGKNPADNFQRILATLGFIFLIFGFILQAVANWIQYTLIP